MYQQVVGEDSREIFDRNIKEENICRMVEVKVNFDYDAEQHDELTIRVGDIIKNVSTPEGGWWEGELNGKKGLFPDNFVEVIKNPEKSKDRDKHDKEKDGADITAQRSSTKGHVAELANKLRDGVHIGGGPPKKRESLNKKKLKAKASFAYTPENDDELALEVGDVLEILKQEEEGWWEGNLNGKVGMFPSNFVELLDENGEEAEKTDEPKKDGDFQEIKGKKVQGFGFGNIFGGGPIKLKNKGASVKKVGPPETAERKKEDKTESPTMREKTGRHKGKGRKGRKGRSREVLVSQATDSTYIHISHGSKGLADTDRKTKTGLKPVRCSTPNIPSGKDIPHRIQIVKTPLSKTSGHGSMSNKQFAVSFDISSIEPHINVKVARPRCNSDCIIEQTVSFASPEQQELDQDVGFVSPPFDESQESIDQFVPSDGSLSTACLTDSMILHKRRLSSPRDSGAVRSVNSHLDHIAKKFWTTDPEPSPPSGKGDSLLKKSSTSLSKFRSFVKNMFTSPTQSDGLDESDGKPSEQVKKTQSLLPLGKKRRWTLPMSLTKTSDASCENVKKSKGPEQSTCDNLIEQDSSSNNSCVVQTCNTVYQTDEFLGDPLSFPLKTSPQTYLASLNNHGKLPPYIQLIAKRYNLLDVLDGKRKVLHSSFDHLPIKEYYFDDSKNPFLEQRDNSDDNDPYIMYYSQSRPMSQSIGTTCEKGASAEDVQLSTKEVEDTAENAVAAVLFSIIQSPEDKFDGMRAPLASPDFKEGPTSVAQNLPACDLPKTVPGRNSLFSEARRKFFATKDVEEPHVDPFEKYRTHRHSLPMESKETRSVSNRFTPILDSYFTGVGKISSANFEEIPLTPPVKSDCSGDRMYQECFSPDTEESSPCCEHNYSISLMSSFLAEEERPLTPEKYPSFISMSCDDADITAPEASAESSLESIGQQQPTSPVVKPNYKWLTFKNQAQTVSRDSFDEVDKDLESGNCIVEVSPEVLEICAEDVKKHYMWNQKGKGSNFSFSQSVAHHRDDSESHVHLSTVQGQTDLAASKKIDPKDFFDGETRASLTRSRVFTSLQRELIEGDLPENFQASFSESIQKPSLSDSVTVAIQVPDDIFCMEDEEDVTNSIDLQSSLQLDVSSSSNYTIPKGFRGAWRRPSSRILESSFESLPGRFRRQSPAKTNSVKRPLSWMYPEISKLDLSSSNLVSKSLNRVPEAEQSNRYLIIDSSSTLTSIHSVRDSLCSRQSVLDGDPKLVKGSSEKRKNHRLWKRVHQPKIVKPVELISYKKVYEPGTPMYDMVPLLNRSLTGGDSLCLADNINHNHPGLELGDVGMPIEEVKRMERDHLDMTGDRDSHQEELTDSTTTSLNSTSSVSNNLSDVEEFAELESVADDLTPVSFLSKAYGADDTLTPDHLHHSQGVLDSHIVESNMDTEVGQFVDNILDSAVRSELANQLAYYVDSKCLFRDTTKDGYTDFLSHYGEESDISFNAVCRVAFGMDDDDIQHDELRGFTSVEGADKSESRLSMLPAEVDLPPVACFDSYLHVLDDLSTDTCLSESGTAGSSLFSSVPQSARSVISPDSEDANDRTIENLVADKSRKAALYYSLTDIQPSPSSSSTET
ncbi:uncharacterized protein LOC135469347 isoform X1 [Liolophura sinensis]|uniref:uncharacterized protein LOC135469347 isoform X1 n=1 Tax=Liolophura sinensis TaxID=3198878 RepID=UPI003158607F